MRGLEDGGVGGAGEVVFCDGGGRGGVGHAGWEPGEERQGWEGMGGDGCMMEKEGERG